jgi:hypothetical protein
VVEAKVMREGGGGGSSKKETSEILPVGAEVTGKTLRQDEQLGAEHDRTSRIETIQKYRGTGAILNAASRTNVDDDDSNSSSDVAPLSNRFSVLS